MKEYISRLNSSGKKNTFIFWWVLRVLMLFVFVAGLFNSDATLTYQIHSFLCFAGSFLWELSMAMPKRSIFRLIPPSVHTAINAGLAISSVAGVYFNLYYSTVFFDPAIQAYFSFVAVLYGYEIAYALIKKEHFAATKAMVYFVAFGISFICFNAWELGEFFSDQLVGHLTGRAGNAQFWSVAVSEGTARAKSVIPPLVSERQPLMDLMCDIIVHTLSAFAALIFINLCPYRLRGKYKYNAEYGNNLISVKGIAAGKRISGFFRRLKYNCTTRTYIFWWIIRLAMVGLFIKSLFDEPFKPVISVEILMNLSIMFVWELCMLMPKWTVFQYIQPLMQTAIIVVDFIAVITAYLFNFYYEVRLWDSFLHFGCGFGLVFLGYEFTCALIKKEKKTASLSMIILASAGFSFMCATMWEIFEFSGDQIIGLITGEVASSQFWSYTRLIGTDKMQTIFEYFDIGRYPIMDTMGDIVMNVSGAIISTLLLRLYPYRHKGRFKLDFVIPKEDMINETAEC